MFEPVERVPREVLSAEEPVNLGNSVTSKFRSVNPPREDSNVATPISGLKIDAHGLGLPYSCQMTF